MAPYFDTIKSILNNWDATKYNGSQDVRPWLREIEEKYHIHGIPEIQMTEVAVKSTDGEVNTVLKAMLEAKVAEAGAWSWEDFKESMIQIEDNMRDVLQDVEDGEFRSHHPYAAAALCVTLVGAGAVLVFPAVETTLLGAVGFGSGGVTAESLAAVAQSAIYKGATRGVFSILQSLAATTVVSPFATLAGSGLTAAGAWCGAGYLDKKEPEVVEP